MDYSFINLQWFAAEDEGRTEQPSELKLQKARKEGRVPKSQELSSAFVFLFATITLLIFGKYILKNCAEVFVYFFERINNNLDNSSFFYFFLDHFFKMLLPIAVVCVVVGIVANLFQNKGMIFSLKPITPDLKKLVPKIGQYFKNTLFSFKGVFNIIKSLVKVAIIVVIAFVLIRSNIPDLLMIIKNEGILPALFKVSSIIFKMLIITSILFIAISIMDFFVNKRDFIESMKMTKYEVKQEFKEMEGDPEIKGKLKEAQQKMLQTNIPKMVSESDVVITNPTHYAVAMKYDNATGEAPKVTAKGSDSTALYIKSIAKENDISIIENRPLARALYTDVEVGDIIPQKYFAIVANVYAEILKYNKK